MPISGSRRISCAEPLANLMSIVLKTPQFRSQLCRCLLRLPSSQYLSTASSSSSIISPPGGQQALPVGRYYDIILRNPTPYAEVKPERPPSSATSSKSASASSSSSLKPADVQQSRVDGGLTGSSPSGTIPPAPSLPESPSQARIIFKSKLAGPAERAERLASVRSRSKLVAGVMVPPRPEEPDNCCMSGCVNCVWNRYREEMEEWSAANSEAESRLRAQDAGLTGANQAVVQGDADTAPSAGSDAQGRLERGAQPAAKIAKDFWDDELYANLPVGVREFMKLDKKLKQRHAEDGTTGG